MINSNSIPGLQSQINTTNATLARRYAAGSSYTISTTDPSPQSGSVTGMIAWTTHAEFRYDPGTNWYVALELYEDSVDVFKCVNGVVTSRTRLATF